jgi:hypothetical protein
MNTWYNYISSAEIIRETLNNRIKYNITILDLINDADIIDTIDIYDYLFSYTSPLLQYNYPLQYFAQIIYNPKFNSKKYEYVKKHIINIKYIDEIVEGVRKYHLQ